MLKKIRQMGNLNTVHLMILGVIVNLYQSDTRTGAIYFLNALIFISFRDTYVSIYR